MNERIMIRSVRAALLVLCCLTNTSPAAAFQTASLPLRATISLQHSSPLLNVSPSVNRSGLGRATGFHIASRQHRKANSQSWLESMADGAEESDVSSSVDVDALLKYHGAVAVQFTLFAASLAALDMLVDTIGIQVPFPMVAALFYAASLKSRVFNPLNNARPKMPVGGDSDAPSKGFRDRVMPSWTPPGVIFPIMWLLLIGPTRAYTSALVYESAHHFLNPALLAFLFHLSVCDVWNTINNNESRYGASVTGVLCVTASAVNAAYQYFTVDEMAGNFLGLTLLWFAVASSLVTATWKLNPDPVTGEKEPLYPTVGKRKTEFAWFQPSFLESQ